MLDTIFNGVFDTTLQVNVSIDKFMICIISSVICGIVTAFAYTRKGRYTSGFVATLASLPPVVCVVIMAVNGNIGAGVAVAGAFSLVRFRSVPGTAKEICAIFVAMGTGLVSGMGYIAYAILFSVLMGILTVIYSNMDFGAEKSKKREKTMSITIPEDLDYTSIFDVIFATYTKKYELVNVKTTNMGSLFKLTYNIILNNEDCEKKLIDAVRVRNGNLEIVSSYRDMGTYEL